MEKASKKGALIVVSGPSGVGKGTICRNLLKKDSSLKLAISATTREKRPREEHGKHYFFISNTEFDKLLENDGLLEWTEYNGNRYGTLKSQVESAIAAGERMILEIEIEGGLQIKKKFPETFMVFVKPPSVQALMDRLSKRGTESQNVIAARLKRAEIEMTYMDKYDFVVTNDYLPKAVNALKKRLNKI